MLIKHGKYRIVLKPAAVILVAMAMAYLCRSLVVSGFVALTSTVMAHRIVNDPLVNREFEPPYVPTASPIPHQVATVAGQIGNGWEDRSRWNDVVVEYAPSTTQPHGGGTCQKVVVKDVHTGGAMFCQGVRTEPGKTYEASVWLRAEQPATVTVGVRRLRATAYLLSTDAQVTDKWQRVAVHVPVQEDPLVYFMLEIKQPGIIYIDDAAFTPMAE